MRNERGDRTPGRSSDADEALHRRSGALHRAHRGRPVLPVSCALRCRTSRSPALPSSSITAPPACTATSSKRSTGAPARSSMRCAPPASTADTLVAVHQRQRAVAAVRDARRLGRPAPRRQGYDVGRRRPDAGHLLVARHACGRHRYRDRIGDSIFCRPRRRSPAPSCPATACSTASTCGRAARHGPGPRQTLFYYWDSELRAVRKGRYKAALHHRAAPTAGRAAHEHDAAAAFDLAGIPASVSTWRPPPGVVARLTAAAEAHRRTVEPARRCSGGACRPGRGDCGRCCPNTSR